MITQRAKTRGWRAITICVLMVVGACSGDSGADIVDSQTATTQAPSTTVTPTTTPATTVPATTEPATTTSTAASTTTVPTSTTTEPVATTSAPPTTTAESKLARAALRELLNPTTEARAFRTTSWSAQVLSSSALGVDIAEKIDPTQPTSIIEVDGLGQSHAWLSIGRTLAAQAAQNPAVAAQLAGVSIDVWTTPALVVMDTTGYQVLVDLNPSAPLGPFAPGVSSIDVARFGAAVGGDAAELLVGTSPVDPSAMAAAFPDLLADVDQDPNDPGHFTGSAPYSRLIGVFGGSVDTVAQSAAVPVAQALRLDVDDVTEFYVSFYESITADFDLTVVDGELRSAQYTVDLSGIYVAMFADGSPLASGIPASQRDQVTELFADTEWTLTNRVEFVIDPTIAVVLPPPPYEDRTDMAIEYFAGVGVGAG